MALWTVCELAATTAAVRKKYGKNDTAVLLVALTLFYGMWTVLNRIKKGECFTARVAFPGSINAYSYVERC